MGTRGVAGHHHIMNTQYTHYAHAFSAICKIYIIILTKVTAYSRNDAQQSVTTKTSIPTITHASSLALYHDDVIAKLSSHWRVCVVW